LPDFFGQIWWWLWSSAAALLWEVVGWVASSSSSNKAAGGLCICGCLLLLSSAGHGGEGGENGGVYPPAALAWVSSLPPTRWRGVGRPSTSLSGVLLRWEGVEILLDGELFNKRRVRRLWPLASSSGAFPLLVGRGGGEKKEAAAGLCRCGFRCWNKPGCCPRSFDGDEMSFPLSAGRGGEGEREELVLVTGLVGDTAL
jgi:hypothetical protein